MLPNAFPLPVVDPAAVLPLAGRLPAAPDDLGGVSSSLPDLMPAQREPVMPESAIRVLVVEDEPLYVEQLEAALLDLGYEPVGPAANARTALSLHRAETIDLALLDIQLRGATDGIALAGELLAHRAIPVIFLTSRTDNPTFVRAQEVGPAAYLTKPVELEALRRAMALAVSNFAAHHGAAALPSVAELPAAATLPDALFVKENGLLEKVRLGNVQSVTAEDKLCCLLLTDRVVHVRMSFRELLRYLPAEHFVQIQRSYVVNLDHIERVDPARHLVQVGKQLLPVGPLYQEALMRRLRTVG